jgi:hypothetical protein
VSVQVRARDNSELLQFVDQVAGSVERVPHTRTALVLRKIKDVYEWQVPRRAN